MSGVQLLGRSRTLVCGLQGVGSEVRDPVRTPGLGPASRWGFEEQPHPELDTVGVF